MSLVHSGLVLGLVLALAGCSVGTVTASSRAAGVGGGAGSLGGIVEADSPGGAVERSADRATFTRDYSASRDRTPNFRIESDCARCR